jgi:hypothetical protein
MTRQPVPGDQRAALARLAAQVDAVQADVTAQARLAETLRADVAAHTRTLTDLADTLRTLTTPTTAPDAHRGGTPAPAWASVIDPALAIRWLTDLVAWADRILAVYARLMPCWPWHPMVVADLLVLRHQWTTAASDGAGPDLLAAWHDRWAQSALRRVETATRTCHRSGCHVEAGTFSTPDRARLDEYAYWWATTHGRPEHAHHAQAYRFDQDNVAPLHGRAPEDLPPGLIRGRQ